MDKAGRYPQTGRPRGFVRAALVVVLAARNRPAEPSPDQGHRVDLLY